MTATGGWLASERVPDVIHGVTEAAVKLVRLKVWLTVVAGSVLMATMAKCRSWVLVGADQSGLKFAVGTPMR